MIQTFKMQYTNKILQLKNKSKFQTTGTTIIKHAFLHSILHIFIYFLELNYKKIPSMLTYPFKCFDNNIVQFILLFFSKLKVYLRYFLKLL